MMLFLTFLHSLIKTKLFAELFAEFYHKTNALPGNATLKKLTPRASVACLPVAISKTSAVSCTHHILSDTHIIRNPIDNQASVVQRAFPRLDVRRDAAGMRNALADSCRASICEKLRRIRRLRS